MPDNKIRKGGTRVVYPVKTVTLSQSMAVVIGQSMSGLWDWMTKDEVVMAGEFW